MPFSIKESEFEEWYECLKYNNVNILKGRKRDVRDRSQYILLTKIVAS